ncbi:MAG: NfeD family protein [Deltaproteobacteria bacterium]|nr:NfeD family protein [Deltaproteobacteria bacterium]
MLSVYLFTGIVGMIMLGVSIFSGDHDHDAGHGDADHPSHAADNPLGFFSLRFWTYFLAFGGSTGALLTWLTQTPEPFVGAMAGGVGFASAFAARAVLGRVFRDAGASFGTTKGADFVGKDAVVLVDVSPSAAGQVRVQLADGMSDILATSVDEQLAAGEHVVIVEMNAGQAVVAKHPAPKTKVAAKQTV